MKLSIIQRYYLPLIGYAQLWAFHRVVKPGGVLRVAMPDLAASLRHYADNTWAEQSWLEKYGYSWIKTQCEYLNIVFREWEHKWLYDHEELQQRLQEAGFSSVENVSWRSSKFQDLRDRESRMESVLICEAS